MHLDIDLQQYLRFWLHCTVEQNKISEETAATPCVTFIVRNDNQEQFLGGGDQIRVTEYDIEVYGEDIDAVDTLAAKARGLLNGFRGMMGLTTVLGGFVRDQDGNYVPKASHATDEGLHVNSFVWKVIT